MSNVIEAKDIFAQGGCVADLRLLCCPGAEELTNLIDRHLMRWAAQSGMEHGSFIIPCECPRFQSGDAKGLVKDSVRGDDIFIVVDPGNYSMTYKLFGYENHMSPDDHFSNLKRLIQAVAGKAHRVSVIMPSLYGGRQHRREVRESLDCAVALQELQNMGVQNIITFDAHDPRVQNAVPLLSFDNAMPTYQVLKSLLQKMPDLSFDKKDFMVVSPDEGAMNRNMYFSSVLGCNLGMFYKRRDYTTVINGRNPIVAHEYLGESVEGKTVFVADDIVASGDSMLEVARELKQRGAARIIADATFPLSTPPSRRVCSTSWWAPTSPTASPSCSSATGIWTLMSRSTRPTSCWPSITTYRSRPSPTPSARSRPCWPSTPPSVRRQNNGPFDTQKKSVSRLAKRGALFSDRQAQKAGSTGAARSAFG